MKSHILVLQVSKFFALATALLLAWAFFAISQADAVVTDNVPDQASCDSGSVTFTWDGIGIERPVITAMTVDGETVADPTNPADGSIGAAVCSNFENARKVGVFVYRRDGMNSHMDLEGALTPEGDPITADSDITITMSDMGELAEFYSFSLVHGVVSNWTTTGLGTEAATLSVTLSPARTPLVSGSGDSEGCSATPPRCNATASELDVLSASFDMDFDQEETFVSFRGSYFGLVSAVAGFVTTTGVGEDRVLSATLGAPHFLDDGTTPNVGSMRAFLPTAVMNDLFANGQEDDIITTDTLSVTRTEGEDEEATTEEAAFTVTAVDGGYIVAIPDITFSTPVYTIAPAQVVAETPDEPDSPSLPDTGTGPSASHAIWAAMPTSLRRKKVLA